MVFKMTVLPPFNDEGLLPYQDYELTFKQLKESPLVSGEYSSNPETWHTDWRLKLVNYAEILVNQLWQLDPDLVGDIYLDGSFVEDKPHPNDIDGYFECDLKYFASKQLQHDLNALDPNKVWTWDPESRRPYKNYAKHQLPMWFTYRVELYPHFEQSSGIKDDFGNDLMFPAAFRTSRNSKLQKGIIKLKKEG